MIEEPDNAQPPQSPGPQLGSPAPLWILGIASCLGVLGSAIAVYQALTSEPKIPFVAFWQSTAMLLALALAYSFFGAANAATRHRRSKSNDDLQACIHSVWQSLSVLSTYFVLVVLGSAIILLYSIFVSK